MDPDLGLNLKKINLDLNSEKVRSSPKVKKLNLDHYHLNPKIKQNNMIKSTSE